MSKLYEAAQQNTKNSLSGNSITPIGSQNWNHETDKTRQTQMSKSNKKTSQVTISLPIGRSRSVFDESFRNHQMQKRPITVTANCPSLDVKKLDP